MNKKFSNKRKKGFTLIELMVVMAIIGILSSIAVPNFLGQKDEAKLKADQITSQNIALAVKSELIKGKTTQEISNNNYKFIADNYFNGMLPKPQTGDESFNIAISNENVSVSTSKYKFYPKFEKTGI
jgi:type IV pilus assembly protein PilA